MENISKHHKQNKHLNNKKKSLALIHVHHAQHLTPLPCMNIYETLNFEQRT